MISFLISLCCLSVQAPTTPHAATSQQHVAWVADAMKEMQTVKVGMTRKDLLRVFVTEGGLSTGLRRTYAYRNCPYFKVDVQFTPIGRPARDKEGRVTLEESPSDQIAAISRPYLDWAVMD
jgi:hypothetical protein